ncbi:MAG: NAD-dependent epimerase/dehydratase family protein [Trebonia sp.]
MTADISRGQALTGGHVLLTGGAGYIGSVLTRHLLDQGYRVTVVDRFFFGRGTLPAGHVGLACVEKDTRLLSVADFAGVDAVIDLAAISNDPAGELDPGLTWQVNHQARVRCAELARAAGVSRYILPSSSSVYGQQEGLLSETSLIAPRTTYAEANAAAERDALALAGPGFTACAVRQATVFGVSPRMRLDLVVHQMVVQAMSKGSIPVLGDGLQWRPFVHVADVCQAMVLLLRADLGEISGELFNLGGDHLNHTVRDLAEQVGRAVGVTGVHSYPGLDDRSHRMDFAKVRQRLGFVPSRSVADGARETADAISRGDIDTGDPKTMTVQWYQHLLATGANSPAAVAA